MSDEYYTQEERLAVFTEGLALSRKFSAAADGLPNDVVLSAALLMIYGVASVTTNKEGRDSVMETLRSLADHIGDIDKGDGDAAAPEAAA